MKKLTCRIFHLLASHRCILLFPIISSCFSSFLYASSEKAVAYPAPINISQIEIKYNDQLDYPEIIGNITNVSNVVLYQTYIRFELLKDGVFIGETNHRVTSSIKPKQTVNFIVTIPDYDVIPNEQIVVETIAAYYLDKPRWVSFRSQLMMVAPNQSVWWVIHHLCE
nr:FxLYD domain-containing protein [Providencia rettgeri]